MNFGPAEMAQMMDGSKALITFTMVSSISIGLVLGVIVAFWKLHREGVPLAMVPDNRVTPFKRPIFPFRLKIFLLTVAVGGGVLYVGYASHRLDIVKSPDTRQRPDTPQRADIPQRVDIPQRPDTPQRVDVQQRPALRETYTEVYSRLGISPLPEAVEANGSICGPLEQLRRERCDQQAIFNLATALRNAGYRREAAKVDISFSGMCGGYAPSLRRAANVLLELSDYSGAATVASELISFEPLYDNGYYLRALAHDGSGLAEKALDDYVTTLELVGNKDRIFSTPYFNMARLHEKLGRFCDAVLPIEAWVSLNPKHDTSQTRTIIANYTTRGRCATGTRGSAEAFTVPRLNNVVNLPVTINGIRGTFILDTGATFVSLKPGFAQKAGVEVDQESIVHLRTANGIVDGKRGRAQTIQLRSLVAKDVPIVVHAGGAYGDGIDGLLGMSFLSRFNINMDGKTVGISPRTAR